jgi:hypothetical protein
MLAMVDESSSVPSVKRAAISLPAMAPVAGF